MDFPLETTVDISSDEEDEQEQSQLAERSQPKGRVKEDSVMEVAAVEEVVASASNIEDPTTAGNITDVK